MEIKLKINKDVTLGELDRIAKKEKIDIVIDNGKAYAIVEVINKFDFIQKL